MTEEFSRLFPGLPGKLNPPDTALTAGINAILNNAVEEDGIVDDFKVADLSDQDLVTTKDFILISATAKLVEQAIGQGITGNFDRRFLLEIALRMPQRFKRFVLGGRPRQFPSGREFSLGSTTAQIQPEVTSAGTDKDRESISIEALHSWVQSELPPVVDLTRKGGGTLQALRNLKQEGKPLEINGGGGVFLVVGYLIGRAPHQEVVASLTLDPRQGIPDKSACLKEIACQMEERIEQSERLESGDIRKIQPSRPRGQNVICVRHQMPISECGCQPPARMATTLQSGILKEPGA